MVFAKTLDQIDFGDEKQKFFEDILKQLEKFRNYKKESIELKTGEISYHLPQITDDRVTYLLYNDEFVVASVIQIRADSNKTTHNLFENLKEFKQYLLNL